MLETTTSDVTSYIEDVPEKLEKLTIGFSSSVIRLLSAKAGIEHRSKEGQCEIFVLTMLGLYPAEDPIGTPVRVTRPHPVRSRSQKSGKNGTGGS